MSKGKKKQNKKVHKNKYAQHSTAPSSPITSKPKPKPVTQQPVRRSYFWDPEPQQLYHSEPDPDSEIKELAALAAPRQRRKKKGNNQPKRSRRDTYHDPSSPSYDRNIIDFNVINGTARQINQFYSQITVGEPSATVYSALIEQVNKLSSNEALPILLADESNPRNRDYKRIQERLDKIRSELPELEGVLEVRLKEKEERDKVLEKERQKIQQQRNYDSAIIFLYDQIADQGLTLYTLFKKDDMKRGFRNAQFPEGFDITEISFGLMLPLFNATPTTTKDTRAAEKRLKYDTSAAVISFKPKGITDLTDKEQLEAGLGPLIKDLYQDAVANSEPRSFGWGW